MTWLWWAAHFKTPISGGKSFLRISPASSDLLADVCLAQSHLGPCKLIWIKGFSLCKDKIVLIWELILAEHWCMKNIKAMSTPPVYYMVKHCAFESQPRLPKTLLCQPTGLRLTRSVKIKEPPKPHLTRRVHTTLWTRGMATSGTVLWQKTIIKPIFADVFGFKEALWMLVPSLKKCNMLQKAKWSQNMYLI